MQAALPFFIADGAQSQGQQFLRLQYGINIAGITLRITKGVHFAKLSFASLKMAASLLNIY